MFNIDSYEMVNIIEQLGMSSYIANKCIIAKNRILLQCFLTNIYFRYLIKNNL